MFEHGKPLVTVAELSSHLGDASLRIVDVRWVLGNPGAGRIAWSRSRIPGAAFLDVDDDLSQILEARHGRHPLPSPRHFVERLAGCGIGPGNRVVAYDDAGGATAARLWWLLRWVGHDDVAVLDGGLRAWSAAGHPLEEGEPVFALAAPRAIAPVTHNFSVALKPEIEALARAAFAASATPTTTPPTTGTGDGPRAVLLDARAAERYRGDVEPVDPRPGHIPGARNAPCGGNLDPSTSLFLPVEELARRYASLGVTRGVEAICYCGSGVTACHDLLALDLIGHPASLARLYAGSFSEWANDPDRVVVTGAAPLPPRASNPSA